MPELYRIYNGPMPTTASQVPVDTTTSIQTMLQAKLGTAYRSGRVKQWGLSFDGSAAAEPIICELFTSGTVAATVTAHVAAGIQAKDPNITVPATNEPFTLSTITTGYTATVEGSIVATRMFDAQLVAPTNQYIFQEPLGNEWKFSEAEYLRIRVKAPVAVNMICWFEIEA